MSIFALLRGEILDYARTNIKIDLGQLTLFPNGGDALNINDVGIFSCTITNVGLLLVTNLKIHIYTNEYGQVRTTAPLGESIWINEVALGPFSIGPNEVVTLPSLQFKAIKRSNGKKDVVFVYIEAFDLSWHYTLKNQTLHIIEANDNLAFQI